MAATLSRRVPSGTGREGITSTIPHTAETIPIYDKVIFGYDK